MENPEYNLLGPQRGLPGPLQGTKHISGNAFSTCAKLRVEFCMKALKSRIKPNICRGASKHHVVPTFANQDSIRSRLRLLFNNFEGHSHETTLQGLPKQSFDFRKNNLAVALPVLSVTLQSVDIYSLV